MGEVYRARDARLGRTVAIKVLPPGAVERPDRRQRFEREARAVSSLNHPHICTIHDIGREDSVDYLVMEYLEGEDLAQRLKKGPLPLDQALSIAMQVADALDRAHRTGITHRDLKPANIMLTKTGAKVLDFGLAKMRGAEAAAQTTREGSRMETMTSPLTSEGAILGTVQYMAPEQLEGKEADARSDIFAFGAVLYEMVTGRRAFEGASQASIIAAILEREPAPLGQFQPLAPPLLERTIRDCLAKDPDERRQTAHDVLLDLKWIAGQGAATAGGAAGGAVSSRRGRAIWLAAGLAAVLLALAVVRFHGSPSAPAGTMRFGITLPQGESLGGSWWWLPSVAVSPDGKRVAYVATRAGATQMYMRAIDEWEGHPLAGTANANTPFFSPDGQWLGMLSGQNVIKVPVRGGPPVTVTTIPYSVYGASWAPDDTLYFGGDFGLVKAPAGGGNPQPVTKLDARKEETDHRFPEVLPGGKALLFAARHANEPSFDEADIEALVLKTGERRTIVKAGTNPHFVASGYLVFLRAGVLLAAPFDPGKLELQGAPVPVIENVIENPRIGAGQFSVSANGSLMYIPGGVTFGEHELVLVDRKGATRVLTPKTRPYEDFTISPDGRFIATTIEGPMTDTWVRDLARGTDSRFTFGVEHRDPAWSADGKRIAYESYKDGKSTIAWKPLDGTGPEEQLVASDNDVMPWFFSRDGRTLLYAESSPTTRSDVWVLPLDGDRKPYPLLHTAFDEEWAQLSPDSRWIAYNSDESGRPEVYVASFPGLGSKVRISTEGGVHPHWSPDGRELFYRSGTALEADRPLEQRVRVMAVSIETSPVLKAGAPHLLFEGPFFDSSHDYGVTPDGKGFIFIRETQGTPGPGELKVVLNWFEELKSRVPVEGK
jgi:Tol biopolymer transport system component